MEVYKINMKRSPSSMLGIDDGVIQAMPVDYNPPIRETDDYVEVSTQDAVKCFICDRIHVVKVPKGKDELELRFFTLQGNILANFGGGILGNASWDKFGIPTYHSCRKCFIDYIDNLT